MCLWLVLHLSKPTCADFSIVPTDVTSLALISCSRPAKPRVLESSIVQVHTVFVIHETDLWRDPSVSTVYIRMQQNITANTSKNKPSRKRKRDPGIADSVWLTMSSILPYTFFFMPEALFVGLGTIKQKIRP